MGFKKFDDSTWQLINPKKLKGIPYSGTLPATLTDTKAGYLSKYRIFGNVGENLFDKDSANIARGRVNTSGEVAYPDSHYLTSDYIEILNSDACVIHLRSCFSSALRNIFYAYYDESKTFLRYGQTETFRDGEINYVTQIPQNAVYIRFSYIGQNTPDTDVDIMLTKGSTPPESYIPFGECGERTENLFNFNRQRSNTFVLDTTKYIYGARADRPSLEPQFIARFEYDADSFMVLSTGGAGIGFLVEVKPSATYTASFQCDVTVPVDRTSAVFNLITSDGTFGTFWGIYGDDRGSTFTTNADTAYVYLVFRAIGSRATYSNIMLVEGSTPPTSYIPYGYKLPLTSGSTPVDIYIGDDTLSTEEYVDSGTGKIYRMVDGVLTPTDPPVPFPQIPTTANSTTISWAGSGLAPSQFDSIQEWVDIPTYKRVNGAWVADN